MTYQDEQRRTFNEPPVDRDPPLRSGIEWGLPLGLASAVIVIGLIFYTVNHQPTTTAANSGGTVHSTPAQNAEKAAPPATKTQ